MRSILAVSLLLSPALFTSAAIASQPKADAPAITQVSQVGTGTTSPATLNSLNLHIPASVLEGNASTGAKVVLSLNVDAKGNAQNIRVLHSSNPALDARVVAAVRQSYFHPARLDNHAVPVAVDLVVSVQR